MTTGIREIVLEEQLVESRSCNKSYRGLSLNDLCRQLGHYNRNVRQDAVIGVKQLLSSNPHLISSSLHLIIPSVARLISDERNDGHFRSQLKSLLNLLFCVPSDAMCSHFELLLAHVLLALTHLKLPVRTFGVTIVLLLMQKYPRLCSRKSDLFSSLIDVISSSRKLLKRKLLIDVMLGILDVYFVTDKKSCGPLSIAYFSADLKNCSQVDLATNTTYFECPILSLNSTEEASPFSTWKGVLKFCTAVFPLLESLLFEENFDCDGICAEVIGKISQIVENVREMREDADLQKKYVSIASSYVSLVSRTKNYPKLKKSIQNLVS